MRSHGHRSRVCGDTQGCLWRVPPNWPRLLAAPQPIAPFTSHPPRPAGGHSSGPLRGSRGQALKERAEPQTPSKHTKRVEAEKELKSMERGGQSRKDIHKLKADVQTRWN